MFSEVEFVFIVVAAVVDALTFDDDSAVNVAVVFTRSVFCFDGFTVDTTGSGRTAPVLGDDLANDSEEEVTLLNVKTSSGFIDDVTERCIDGENLIGSDSSADSVVVELFC